MKKPLRRRPYFRRTKSLYQQNDECEINIHPNVSTKPTPRPTSKPKSIQSLASPPSPNSKSDAKSPSISLPPSSSLLSVLTPLQTLQSVQNQSRKSLNRKRRLGNKIDVYKDDYCNKHRDQNHNTNKKKIHKKRKCDKSKINKELKEETDEEVIKYFYEKE